MGPLSGTFWSFISNFSTGPYVKPLLTVSGNFVEPGSRFRAAVPNHPEALLEEPQAFQAVGGENNFSLCHSPGLHHWLPSQSFAPRISSTRTHGPLQQHQAPSPPAATTHLERRQRGQKEKKMQRFVGEKTVIKGKKLLLQPTVQEQLECNENSSGSSPAALGMCPEMA